MEAHRSLWVENLPERVSGGLGVCHCEHPTLRHASPEIGALTEPSLYPKLEVETTGATADVRIRHPDADATMSIIIPTLTA